MTPMIFALIFAISLHVESNDESMKYLITTALNLYFITFEGYF